MCSVTVDRPCHRPLEPQTRSSRSSRENTRPGEAARNARRSNSFPRHRDFGLEDCDGTCPLVDHQVAVVEGGRRRRTATPQDGAHPGFELREREGLGDDIVGTEVEQADAVPFPGATRADDHRDRATAPDLGQDIRGLSTQVEVEDDQVGRGTEDDLERGRSVGSFSDVVAQPLQVVLERPAAVLVVLGHQDRPVDNIVGSWGEHHHGIRAHGPQAALIALGRRDIQRHSHTPPAMAPRRPMSRCTAPRRRSTGNEPNLIETPPRSPAGLSDAAPGRHSRVPVVSLLSMSARGPTGSIGLSDQHCDVMV